MSKKQFFEESLRDFKTAGSLIPSQKFLIKKMTKQIKQNQKSLIIEFGSGEGCVTKKILEKMSKDSHLLSFEINKKLAKTTKNELKKEKRVEIIEDDVNNVNKYLKDRKADIIISSLPLGTMQKEDVLKIISVGKKVLKKEGLFIQYQYLCLDIFKFLKNFNQTKIGWQPLNFPPAFVYECKK